MTEPDAPATGSTRIKWKKIMGKKSVKIRKRRDDRHKMGGISNTSIK